MLMYGWRRNFGSDTVVESMSRAFLCSYSRRVLSDWNMWTMISRQKNSLKCWRNPFAHLFVRHVPIHLVKLMIPNLSPRGDASAMTKNRPHRRQIRVWFSKRQVSLPFHAGRFRRLGTSLSPQSQQQQIMTTLAGITPFYGMWIMATYCTLRARIFRPFS